MADIGVIFALLLGDFHSLLHLHFLDEIATRVTPIAYDIQREANKWDYVSALPNQLIIRLGLGDPWQGAINLIGSQTIPPDSCKLCSGCTLRTVRPTLTNDQRGHHLTSLCKDFADFLPSHSLVVVWSRVESPPPSARVHRPLHCCPRPALSCIMSLHHFPTNVSDTKKTMK